MTPSPTSRPSPSSLLPPGRWTSCGPGSTAGVRVGARRLHFRAGVERFGARLDVERSGAATLTGGVPGRRLFELRFETGQMTCDGGFVELDGLLTVDAGPVRVVARGALDETTGARRRLSLETVFDRRQLGLDWPGLDDEVTLFADLELERA